VAWSFDADCPDCGHHWEGIEATLRIGPWTRGGGDAQHLFCRRCYNRLWLPRSMERKAWRRWSERFLAEPSGRGAWLLGLLARIDASFASAGWYVPHPIDPGAVGCPGCGSPMVPGAAEGDHLECPACGSLAPVLAGFTSHVSLAVGEDGFA